MGTAQSASPAPTAVHPLKRVRYDHNVSRRDLADESGVSYQTIVQVEDHGTTPREGTAYALAAAINKLAGLKGKNRFRGSDVLDQAELTGTGA